jgi:predicted lipid-binding transport protein (Tim44 family)
MDHSFSLDIIVFAVIAAVLFFRLRKVLGERSDGEPPSVDPSVLLRAKPADAAIQLADKTAALPAPIHWAQDMPDYQLVLNATTHHRLLPIAAVDPNFQPHAFLAGARRAYDMIIAAFARGDSNALAKLVTPDVLADFQSEIDRRIAAQQHLDVSVQTVKQAIISDASLDGIQVYITVDFVTEQSITLRDGQGQIVDGQDGTTQTVRERWTFTDNLKDNETFWRLSETDNLDD